MPFSSVISLSSFLGVLDNAELVILQMMISGNLKVWSKNYFKLAYVGKYREPFMLLLFRNNF